MKFTMRATYSDITWGAEGEDDYEEENGWTDPHNPWGGFTSEDEPTVVEFDSLSEAVHFVVDFPGGVWDFRESESDCVDYGTGRNRQVTLHVNDDDQERIFKWAAIVEHIKDARIRAMQARYLEGRQS